MMMRLVYALLLALLVRMRLLSRVVDIVVRTYSIGCSQRRGGAWVPPKRAALAGRQCLDGWYGVVSYSHSCVGLYLRKLAGMCRVCLKECAPV